MASLTIQLPDEQYAALVSKARAKGLSAEQYARELLAHDLAPEWLRESWEVAREGGHDRLSAEEIDAEIAASRKARLAPRPQPGRATPEAVSGLPNSAIIDDPIIQILMSTAAAFQKVEAGRSWLLTPSPGLGNVAPVSLIMTPEGREMIAGSILMLR